MIQIAAESQSASELVNGPLSNRLSRTLATDRQSSESDPTVAFVGYSTWRREENGDANLFDEQVFAVRDGKARLLEPRYDLENFSPDGLSWGYCGSGPSQLAIAMLMKVLGDWNRVAPIWGLFRDHFVAKLPREANWTADGADILAIVQAIERHQELERLCS
jgi:hypothetical protein